MFKKHRRKSSALSRFGRTVSDVCKATVLMLTVVLVGFEVYSKCRKGIA